jgi:hypothetical protein
LSLAVLIHAGALAFLPGLDAPDLRSRASALLALDLPPYLQIPPPPTVIVDSSGHEDLDDVAEEVAKGMAWTPALNRDRATPVWLMQHITFSPSQSVVGGGTRLP